MAKDYSHKNLQNKVFVNEDLHHARFSNSDLRGADFSGSNLAGADFSNVKTGLTPANTGWIFLTALLTSALSGYIAMLAGRTIHIMLVATDSKIRTAGIITAALILLFSVFAFLRGVDRKSVG